MSTDIIRAAAEKTTQNEILETTLNKDEIPEILQLAHSKATEENRRTRHKVNKQSKYTDEETEIGREDLKSHATTKATSNIMMYVQVESSTWRVVSPKH